MATSVYNEVCCLLETVVYNELCCLLETCIQWTMLSFGNCCEQWTVLSVRPSAHGELGFQINMFVGDYCLQSTGLLFCFWDRCIQWTGLSFWRPRYKELGYFGDCCLQRTGLFVGDKYSRWTVLSVGDQMICAVALQSSGAVWKSRWTSWAPDPNKPTVSVDVKQHFNNKAVAWRVTPWAVAGGHPMDTKITR